MRTEIPIEHLIEWIETEMMDDEMAMDNAKLKGEWRRYNVLDGHRQGLLAVKHHIKAFQVNPPD